MNPTWLYVALVYGGAIWLARRVADIPWRIAVFFYLLVLLFMFRPMTGPWINIPVDCAHRLPPWSYVTQIRGAQNPEMNDVAQQIAPWAHQVRQSWKSGRVPLWNDLSGAGYPLLANGQSSALSLLRILALPLPLGYAFTAEAAWKLLIALTFAWLFCRRRGYSELASAVGAVSFGFCTFLIVWLHFPLVTVAVFLPAALYQIDLLAERVTYARFLFAIGLWAVMLFGGHPETVSHIFFLALLYLAWILVVERVLPRRMALRLTSILAAALLLSALVAAPFLAPFAEAVRRSKRYQELRVQPNEIGYYSDRPSQALLLQPHFFGAVPRELAWGPARAESITGFAGFLAVAAWFGVLCDVALRRRWRSREAFFLLATPIILGIILAWPVVSTIFHAVFKLAANARLRLLLCFVLSVLAASTVDSLQRGRIRPYLAGLAAASLILLGLFYRTVFPNDWARDTAMLAILPSMIVLAFAALAAVPKIRALATMVLLVAIIAELWKIDRTWWPLLPERLNYPVTPLIERLNTLVRQQPSESPVRVVGIGAVLFPNTQAVYGLPDIRAHDPMSNGRYLGLLRVLTGYDTSDYFARWDNVDTRLLDFLNVKYLATTPRGELADTERYRMVYDGKDGRIFENVSVLPRFYPVRNVVIEFKRDLFVQRLIRNDNDWSLTAILRSLKVEDERMRRDFFLPRGPGSPEATLRMITAGATEYEMEVHSPRYSLIVSSLPMWPGWRIERNGRSSEVIEVNGAFLGFAAPPGKTRVRVYYDPWSFKLGVLCSVLTLLALAVPFAESWRRQRQSAAGSAPMRAHFLLRRAVLPD